VTQTAVAQVDGRRRSGPSVAGSVTRVAVAGLVVAALLALATGVLARKAGAEEATRSFQRLAAVVAGSVVAPELTQQLLTGDPAAGERLARVVDPLLEAGAVQHITVRKADGQVLWSDQPELAGSTGPLRPDQRTALRNGTVVSADDADPADGLTTSVGVRDAAGAPLLVEVGERRSDVEANARTAWRHFAPASLGALLLLELVQVPVIWWLARRVRRAQDAEDALRQSAEGAAEVERRRIAAEVHDNVLPGLTGLTYDLDAARLGAPGAEVLRTLLARTATGLRTSIGELRALLVDLGRSRLPDAGLSTALAALAYRMELRGTRVGIRAADLDHLPRPVAEMLYRCAEETLRNIAAHSGAEQVEVSVHRDGDDVHLVIEDDGRGFDDSRLARSEAAGHLGLRALGGLVADAGGSLTASSAPGQGTRVAATLPLEAERRRVGAGS
jgi:two-component system NarL family sensor kinase